MKGRMKFGVGGEKGSVWEEKRRGGGGGFLGLEKGYGVIRERINSLLVFSSCFNHGEGGGGV